MAKHFAAECHAKPHVEFPQITETSYSYMVILSEVSVLEMKNKKILFANKSLTLKFTAFDLLAQRSNIRRTLNAQGRTETWYNTIPRYFLFSLAWRFHKAPRQNRYNE